MGDGSDPCLLWTNLIENPNQLRNLLQVGLKKRPIFFVELCF